MHDIVISSGQATDEVSVYMLTNEICLAGHRGSVVACATYKREIAVRSPAALNMLRRCTPRQGTLLTCTLLRPRSKWVPGRTVKACVFE